MFSKWTIFLVFGVISSLNGRNLDSLLAVLKNAKADTHKVFLLNQVSKAYLKKDAEKSVEFARKGLHLADSLSYQRGKASSLHILGFALRNQGDNYSSERYFKEAYNLYMHSGNSDEAVSCLSNLAFVYRNRGDYQQAVKLQFRVLKYYEETGNAEYIAGSLNNIANIYRVQKKSGNALDNYRKAVKIGIESKIDKILPVAYSNIGLVHATEGRFDSALYYYRKTLALDLKSGDLEGQAICYANLAGVYDETIVLDSAYYYYRRSGEIYEQIGHTVDAAREKMKVGSLYSWEKKYKEALKIFIETYPTISETDNPLYMKELTFNLYEVHENMGNSDEALKYHKEYMMWKDKMFNEETTKALAQSEMKYNFEKIEAENKMQQDKKDALAAEKDHRQQYIIWFSVSGFLLVAIFSFYLFTRFRLIRRQKQIIEEQKIDVMKAYDQLQLKNNEVLDSIKYARRIQSTLMSNEKYIAKKLKELKK